MYAVYTPSKFDGLCHIWYNVKVIYIKSLLFLIKHTRG